LGEGDGADSGYGDSIDFAASLKVQFRDGGAMWVGRGRECNHPVNQLTFEYYEFVLKTEILNRSQLKKDFIET
jgi:hypothetical protein